MLFPGIRSRSRRVKGGRPSPVDFFRSRSCWYFFLNCAAQAAGTRIKNLEVAAGKTRISTSGSQIFFLFERNFENINHNKMMMMMLL